MVVSVEVFDTSHKKPAVNLKISFCRSLTIAPNGVVMSWEKIEDGVTDNNGQYTALSGVQQQTPLASGQYKLVFKVGQYYEKLGTRSPHLYDEILFEIASHSQDTHYKLVVNPKTGLVQAE